jgi:hypothetical protein
MSSVVAPPPPGSQSAAAESSTTTKAYSPDAPQPAYAGAAAAPAGAADSIADDSEAAPLRFKGTQPVRRGRTAVPGEKAALLC